MRWFLFETKLGELLLVLLERYAGLAFVQAECLGVQYSGEPRNAAKAQNDPQLCPPEDQEAING